MKKRDVYEFQDIKKIDNQLFIISKIYSYSDQTINNA